MQIKPGTKKITASLEEANFVSLLIDRITSKGGGTIFKTADYAKECMIDGDAMNAIIENLCTRGILVLNDSEGGSMMEGQAQFTSMWEVEAVCITLKAHHKHLPGTEESESTDDE